MSKNIKVVKSSLINKINNKISNNYDSNYKEAENYNLSKSKLTTSFKTLNDKKFKSNNLVDLNQNNIKNTAYYHKNKEKINYNPKQTIENNNNIHNHKTKKNYDKKSLNINPISNFKDNVKDLEDLEIESLENKIKELKNSIKSKDDVSVNNIHK